MFWGTHHSYLLARRIAFVVGMTFIMSVSLFTVQSAPLQQTVTPTTNPGEIYGSLLSGITDTTHEIFLRGQLNGNRINIFSKVGDSMSIHPPSLYPIGWGGYELHDYDYLLPVIRYFSFATARDGNSFSNHSLSAASGWTSADVFKPSVTNADYLKNCRVAEAPLLCEYRIVKPSIAFIMLGTDDVALLTTQQTNAYLRLVIKVTIEHGIVPVLNTIPVRVGYEQQVIDFNNLVKELSVEYGIPMWDYGLIMSGLPNGGIVKDGIHPSSPPGPSSEAANFTEENLQYGYVVRNLLVLHVLDKLWREVIFA